MQPISFSGKIEFTAQDIRRVLNPRSVYVGAHFEDDSGVYHNQMPDFYQRGIWHLGHGRDKEQYNKVIDQLERGDILKVKRLNGKAQNTMKIIAMGIVVGFPELFNEERTLVYVAWTLPHLDIDVPLETVGTMGLLKPIAELEPGILKDKLETCRVRFISQNLQAITHTLYQK